MAYFAKISALFLWFDDVEYREAHRSSPRSRSTMKVTDRWNTWNVTGINFFSSSAVGLEVSYALAYADLRLSEVRDRSLLDLGSHSIAHGYFEHEIELAPAKVRVRVGAEKDVIVMRFEARDQPHHMVIEAKLGSSPFGPGSKIAKKGEVIQGTGKGGKRYELRFLEGDAELAGDFLLVPLDAPAHLVFTPVSKKSRFKTAKDVKALLDRQQKSYAKATTNGNRKLSEAQRIMTKAVNMNVVYSPEFKRVAPTVSRAWSAGPINRGPVFFNWDTMLQSLLAAYESKEVAYDGVMTILEQIYPDGMMPAVVGSYLETPDRSLPPLEAYCVMKLYRRFGDKELLRKALPYLMRKQDWYLPKCDGNGDGLVEPYSFKVKVSAERRRRIDKIDRLLPYGIGFGNLQGAKYSTGTDNGPAFDDMEFDEKSQTGKMADVGLNALLVLEAQIIAEIAGILKKKPEQARFLKMAAEIGERINERLWDDRAKIYKNRYWNGKFNDTLGPVCFYPMLAGIASKQQAKALVEKHLLNPREFWGKFVIPTVSRNHPAFKEQDYWRGRIWGPTNYLVFDGLRRYGFKKVAREFAKKSWDLFMQEYRKDSHIHECYNAVTGDGDDTNTTADDKIPSEVFYPWGALLLMMSFEKDSAWDVIEGWKPPA
jgi:hypothetical protein